MPSATFSHTVSVDASPTRAWEVLQDPDTWSRIGPVSDVTNPTYLEDGTLSGFDWVANVGGKKYDGSAVGGAYTTAERFTMTLDTSEIAGDVVATIAPGNPSTDVTVEITFRTKGMLSAMFFPAIRQALASGFPQQVEDLAAAI
ncbi:MAG TPA: SRPBCC family protein [Acidimicrobiia bacterium]|nr:SRPBCC family protein [Acidimicrobiia bacterium]